MALNVSLPPYIIFLASNISFNFTAAYTAHDSPIRYVTLAFLALCAYVLPHSLASFAQTTGWPGRIAAGSAFWNIVACFDRLVLRGWDYQHYGPSENGTNEKAKAPRDEKSNSHANQYSGTRAEFGNEVTASARGTGFFWQVKSVPHFSRIDPRFVPSQAAFIFMQSIIAILCYYIHSLTVEMTFGVDPKYLSVERVPFLTRLTEVSVAELQVRFIDTLGFWILQWCLMQCFYSVAGVVSAIMKPSGIHLWRPLFGSLQDAYTIRNFWGKTWHQNLRSGLEGVSSFFTHEVLQLPQKGMLQRYTKVLSSFALSGLMHVAADMGGGVSYLESGATQFFCMQALGIIIEDCVQAVYQRGFKREASLVERTIGYCWVLLFLVWTTPVWTFPASLNKRKEDAFLSFGAVKPVFAGK